MEKLELIDGKNFCKAIKEMLKGGTIVSSITDEDKSLGMWAMVTEIMIGNKYYYGMWEKEPLNNKNWQLLYFGEQPDIEPKWNEYVEMWKKEGKITGKK